VDEARSAIVDFLFFIFDLRTVPELVERGIYDLRTDAIAFEIVIAPEGRYCNSSNRALSLKAPEGRHRIV
jgi:hypothetical protein